MDGHDAQATVGKDVSNHGADAVLTDGPDTVGAKQDYPHSLKASNSDEEKASSSLTEPRRRSTIAGPALDVVQAIHTENPLHPIHWPTGKKWLISLVYATLQVFVTLTSTSYVSAESAIMEQFNITSSQVVTLGQSMFIVGTAVGPAFLGPLSDIGGRKWVYFFSILLYAVLNFGCAFAVDMGMLAVFMFLIGCAGSVALCNVAGTIADLFGDTDGASQPMALFVTSANIGPSLGSPIGEWIIENGWMTEHRGWAWIFFINIIIAVVFSAGLAFMPETLPRVVIARAAKAASEDPDKAIVAGSGKDTGDTAVLNSEIKVWQELRFVATMAFRIMLFEPIVTFLAIYNGFAYGLLFLYLDGVFDVFFVNNGLSYLGADLTFLNFAVGVTIMFCFVPVQTYLYRRDRLRQANSIGRPEARFLTSLVLVWGFPISLFWFAFTSTGNVSFWSPVVAGGLLGFCDPLLWLAMLNYITDSYPNVAASAVAAFLIPSFLLAAAFAHIGLVMFDRLSTQWAVAILAFVSLGLVALVYVIYFFGPRLRRRSRLARSH